MNLDPAMVEATAGSLLIGMECTCESCCDNAVKHARSILTAALSSLPDGVYVGNDGKRREFDTRFYLDMISELLEAANAAVIQAETDGAVAAIDTLAEGLMECDGISDEASASYRRRKQALVEEGSE